MNTIHVSIAGHEYQFTLNFAGTKEYFDCFLTSGEECAAYDVVQPVSVEAVGREMGRLGSGPAFAEYSLLIEPFSDVVLHKCCFLFHGAAFIWKGGAYLFTGKSGVGKTTQLYNWMRMYGSGTEIINGDKPAVSVKDDGLYVHPSPWTGKEGWSGTKSARLRGIILLEQGRENSIRQMNEQEAVFPMFLQFLYVPDTTEKVEMVCGYLESLLRNIPVWKLVNDGSMISTEMVHEIIGEGL